MHIIYSPWDKPLAFLQSQGNGSGSLFSTGTQTEQSPFCPLLLGTLRSVPWPTVCRNYDIYQFFLCTGFCMVLLTQVCSEPSLLSLNLCGSCKPWCLTLSRRGATTDMSFATNTSGKELVLFLLSISALL